METGARPVRWDSDPDTVALYAVSVKGLVEGSLLPQGLALALEMHRMDGLVLERYEDLERGVVVFRARRARAHERSGYVAGNLLLKAARGEVQAVDPPDAGD